jgi:hypothetical protein
VMSAGESPALEPAKSGLWRWAYLLTIWVTLTKDLTSNLNSLICGNWKQ